MSGMYVTVAPVPRIPTLPFVLCQQAPPHLSYSKSHSDTNPISGLPTRFFEGEETARDVKLPLRSGEEGFCLDAITAVSTTRHGLTQYCVAPRSCR